MSQSSSGSFSSEATKIHYKRKSVSPSISSTSNSPPNKENFKFERNSHKRARSRSLDKFNSRRKSNSPSAVRKMKKSRSAISKLSEHRKLESRVCNRRIRHNKLLHPPLLTKIKKSVKSIASASGE